jgi:hypothetical protein
LPSLEQAHHWAEEEDAMRKSRYGMLAGLAGAAFAWWYRRHRRSSHGGSNTGHTEVIYSNTPTVP